MATYSEAGTSIIDNTDDIVTVSERIDTFFSQQDDYDDSKTTEIVSHNLLSYGSSVGNGSLQYSLNDSHRGNEFEWKFRHTVSYWISISFIFGSLLFMTASIFSTMQNSLTSNDYYVLVTVAYFSGSTAFLIASYFGYYEVINEQNSNKNKILCLLTPRKTMNCWTALMFLIGSGFYQISVTFALMKVQFDEYSIGWFLIEKIPIFCGGIFFFIGGILEMYLNTFWRLRVYKLGWFVSWFNGIGGFCFFIAGIGIFFDNNKSIFLWSTQIPYIIGSFLYLIASILSLFMWKLHQFGLVYLPNLNRNYIYYTNKRFYQIKKDMVMYRDILFLVLYVVTAALGITAMSYASLCKEYSDWIKNFVLATIGSIGILSLGSVMHREPAHAPYSYLTWFLRFYMVFYTINLIIDAYHISGNQCHKYGSK